MAPAQLVDAACLKQALRMCHICKQPWGVLTAVTPNASFRRRSPYSSFYEPSLYRFGRVLPIDYPSIRPPGDDPRFHFGRCDKPRSYL